MKTSSPYQTSVLQDYILSLEFSSLADMEVILKPVSDFYEGPIVNRQGHNFPRETLMSYMKQTAAQPCQSSLFKHMEQNKQFRYLIAFLKGDVKTKLHELRHAMYHVDAQYREYVASLWDSMTSKEQHNVVAFLTKLGYDAKVHLDEFQAYLFTEPLNFWGMQLSIIDCIPELKNSRGGKGKGAGKGRR